MKENILIDNLVPAKETATEFSVSEISNLIRKNLEHNFAYVKVRGEISGLKIAPSGHVYLSLKDENSVLAVVCWKNVFQKMKFKPEDGMEVVCIGNITSYPGSSRYQLNAEYFEHTGTGTLVAMLEKKKQQFIAEGLFKQEHKKILPSFPQRIGVVTSPTGAVIRDIIHRASDRFPTQILVWPVLVQGQGAEQQIANAITGFNELTEKPDVIIVARGGGSIEDLWCFNSEEVVRAVFASKIPVISAVGHETDFTLIDFVADVRAPTPTAAAEIALPVLNELRDRLKKLNDRLSREIMFFLHNKASRIEILTKSLPRSNYLYQKSQQKITDLFSNLQKIVVKIISGKEQSYYKLLPKLVEPKIFIERSEIRLLNSSNLLPKILKNYFHNIETRLQNRCSMLEALSHKGTLKRGYSLIYDQLSGKLLTSTTQLNKDQEVEILMNDGKKVARII